MLKMKINCKWLFVVLLTLIALILRLHALDRYSLWFDEGVTVWKIHQPWVRIFSLSRIDTVPPLYYWILKSWVAVWGESDFKLRLLSVIFGTAAIPVIYLLGRFLFSGGAGMAAALLLTLSTYHIQYSQEARSYALLFLSFSLALFFLLATSDSPRGRYWVGYVLSGTILMYSHGISIFYLAAINLLYLARCKHRIMSVFRQWLTANLCISILFLPWLLVYLRQMEAFKEQTLIPLPSGSWISGTMILLASLPPANLQLLPRFLGSSPAVLPAIHLIWFVSIVGMYSVSWLTGIQRKSSHIIMLHSLFLLPFSMIVLFSLAVRSIYVDRLFLVCLLPLFLLLVAPLYLGIQLQKQIVLLLLFSYSLCNVLSIQAYYRSPWKPDYRGATEFINQNAQPGDVVIFVAHVGELIYDWYSWGNRSDLIKVGLPQGIYEGEEPDSGLVIRTAVDVSKLKDIRKPGRRYWLFLSRLFTHDKLGFTRSWMEEHFHRLQRSQFNQIELISYEVPSSQ